MRFLLVHIGDPSSNQATTLESQMIHMIQELFGQTPKTEPIESGRSNALLQGLHLSILKVDQRPSSSMAARHHRIGNTLSHFVAVFVCRNLFADIFQGGRHVCDRVLIKLCQQLSSAVFSVSGEITRHGSETAPFMRSAD